MLYGGKVADTLFFSTSGGRTASAAEATGTAVPYLVPVTDPYDTISPFHDWGPVLYDAAKVARQLKLAPPLANLSIADGPSGRATSVTATAAGDTHATVTAAQFRAMLELRSTWFTSALLSLEPQARTITFGGSLSLTGVARGADSVTLESKDPGHDWSPAGELILDADGSFATIVKPTVATQYRLDWETVRAGLTTVAVAARVEAQSSATGVQGTERPVVSGAAVQLQQQAGAAWTTVSSTTADAGGAWRFSGAPQTGTLPRPLRTRSRARRRAVGDVPGAVRQTVVLALAAVPLAIPTAAFGFDNTEPYAGREWYLDQDSAWSFWPTLPQLAPIKVAVIDWGSTVITLT